jgi:hypothetical protein
MGLVRAAIYFIIGNLFLSLLEKHTGKVKDIYLIGPLYGDKLEIYIKENSCTLIVIVMSLLALVL